MAADVKTSAFATSCNVGLWGRSETNFAGSFYFSEFSPCSGGGTTGFVVSGTGATVSHSWLAITISNGSYQFGASAGSFSGGTWTDVNCDGSSNPPSTSPITYGPKFFNITDWPRL
jgi:hypothetical protein